MYTINKKKKHNKKYDIEELDGFLMSSHSNTFIISDTSVENIKVVDKKLAYPLVSRKISKQYQNLITLLLELLSSDDDSGSNLREVLDKIEKFRMSIKNKYRNYLKKQELEIMGKQLGVMQKEAQKRLLEIQDEFYLENMIGKGK